MKKDYLKFGKVTSINTCADYFIITFEKQIVRVDAYGDCCSYSWLEFPENLDKLIGKRITHIETVGIEIGLPESNIQEFDQNTLLYIHTEKDDPIMFYLRNSSNGYYGGWIEISCNEHHGPIIPDNLMKIGNKLSDVLILH